MRWAREVTPELIGHIKHRYEETDELVRSIAADTGVRERKIYEWAVQYKWRKRRDRPPRDLLPELRLRADVDRALQEADTEAEAVQSGPDPVSDTLSTADRLERLLEQNLARVEHLRATQWPQSAAEAERTTRVLERLTQALLKVRQLRNPGTNTAGNNDSDMPRDIDEFRRALARRIDAFVRSRTGAALPGPGESGHAG